MALSVQNLRSITPGGVPSFLLAGQLCFNIADKKMFVGDGSSFQTYFSGVQVPVAPGVGWFELPLSSTGFSAEFLLNPESYGSIPNNNDVLTYSSTQGKPLWRPIPGSGSSTVYTTTNAAVQAAPGSNTSSKITAALGGITPLEADSAVVSGLPGSTYQGLYLFQSGTWIFAAGYANPTAIQVPYNNSVTGLVATTVQAAIDDVWQIATTANTTATNALAVANNALTTANNALPRSGGTMTGDINFNGGQPVDAGSF